MSNWRSGIGKRALAWLQDLFSKEPYCNSKDAIIAFVQGNATRTNFLYRDQNVDLNVRINYLGVYTYGLNRLIS